MNNEVIENQKQPEVNEVEVLKQQLADAQKAIEALASKKDELLKETKAAKEEKRKQAELAEQAKKEQLSIAEKNGEFEKLYKQAQEEKQNLAKQLELDRQERRKDKIDIEANKIAIELAKNSKDAVLLKKFIAESIGNIADERGQVDVDVLKSVRQQFETDDLYSSLRKGNQSVGGSAPGNMSSALSTNDLSKLSPVDRINAIRSGKK